MTPGQRRGIAAAILAALAYAFTIPVTKVFVAGTSPWLLAGILYLGSGLGLTVLLLASHRSWSVPLSDTPRLLGAIVCGGVIAPVLMLHGLRGVTGSAAFSTASKIAAANAPQPATAPRDFSQPV